MKKKDEILRMFPANLRGILAQVPGDYEDVQEIRLRAGEPLLLVKDGREYYISPTGKLEKRLCRAAAITPDQIRETVEYMSSYSLYAFEEELRQGFLTLQGGHRVGLAGQAVLEGGRIKTLKYISFLNVRISHQKKGCAEKVLPFLCREGEVLSTLFVSPPRCGKTTILRDMIRLISNGEGITRGMTVGVVDERSELGACYQGVPQNDLGIRTDVLDCCPKASGMMMLIRSMAPEAVAVDEIGSREDLEAIEYARNCGCRLLATVHGNSIEDLKEKPVLRKLVEEKTFDRYVVLSSRLHAGTLEAVYDSRGTPIYESCREKEGLAV